MAESFTTETRRHMKKTTEDALAKLIGYSIAGMLGSVFIVGWFLFYVAIYYLLIYGVNYGLHLAFDWSMLGFTKTVGLALVVRIVRLFL